MLEIQNIIPTGITANRNTYATKQQVNFGKKINQEKILKKSENGKFDISECIKNSAKGVISPFTVLIKHPIITLGTLAATGIACSLIPILGPILTIGFGALSVFQLGKGIKNIVANYSKGDYDKAEKSFTTVGEGIVGVALSALGLKQAAQVVKEGKMMSALKTNTLDATQKEAIALEIKNGGNKNTVKEILSLFTKDGIKATFQQLKPSLIKTRYQELLEYIKSFSARKKAFTDSFKANSDKEFKKTPEGIRRNSLTEEEFKVKTETIYKEVFDKLGIPENQRPKLVIENAEATLGGSYNKQTHTIEINPEAYKCGNIELENTIMHEATHCKESLLRARIPEDIADNIVKEQLISRVKNGESENIIKKGSLIGVEMMKPPKMSEGLKNDFITFAKSKLYKEGTLEDITTDVQALLNKHPDFVSQYDTPKLAFDALMDYSTSHYVRYTFFKRTSIPNIEIKPLTPEELAQAKQSLIDHITTTEGNARMSGLNGIFATDEKFNQYQFSPEEVLAQKNGNTYLIEKLTSKINSLKQTGELTKEQEILLTGLIKKAKAVIEYKNKGLNYYTEYTQMINNPNDKNLAQAVKALEKELRLLKNKINTAQYDAINEYLAPILTMYTPYSTTEIINILS